MHGCICYFCCIGLYASWHVYELPHVIGYGVQVHTAAAGDVSYLPYETGPREDIKSYYHELCPLECQGSWLRFRCARHG